ncbi:hypothetical protein [Cesiribacter andamanensis]|uniref:Uncharacterized protein n=1 Tax=Cesiribacter andamanensis AMV16 TaxID=1279009 RepID=M7N2A0_9BACT|nr:hypothetical protein [Cesiribacter andamanensis]EMR02778.1 hypothetical protein ADICEAN_02052 [Cesiribacter andamanensis AMV16]
MLTPTQQKEVRLTLLNSDIRYYEVYEELSDHYLTAVDERMQAGTPFDQALAATHQSFGKQEGLKKLEKSYRKSAIQHYRRLHWQEFKERFRWPHMVLIVLMGVLSYQLAELLDTRYVIGLIFALSLSPFLFTIFAGSKKTQEPLPLWDNRVFMPTTLRREALSLQSNASLGLFNFFFFGSKILMSETQWKEMMGQLHPALFTALLVFSFVWSWSFYLTVQHTRPKLT